MESVLKLVDDCRYLAAYQLYSSLPIIEPYNTSHPTIALLLERYNEVNNLINYEDLDPDWILGITYYGIKTYYKQTNDFHILIKMEGIMENLPLFEQIAVIHEVDLFSQWMPLCSDSKLVKKVGKAELYPYLHVGFSPVSRDFVLKAYGSDCLNEVGKIVIMAKSVDDNFFDENQNNPPSPLKPIGWFHNRMHVYEIKFVVDVISPTAGKTTAFAHVDLKLPLPQSLINFLLKNAAGIILYTLQQRALKVFNDPTCETAQRIRNDAIFYEGWILPRLREYFQLKGWDCPPVTSLSEKSLTEDNQSTTKSEELR